MATYARQLDRRPLGGTRILLGLVLPLVACASLAWAQVGPIRDQAAAAPQPTGTGRITGQVVAADSGAPVKRAQVVVTGMAVPARAGAGVEGGAVSGGAFIPDVPLQSAGGQPAGMVRKQTETDESGRFDFTGLPAGQFNLMVTPATGFVSPPRLESVRLTDGQSATVTIKLPRAGAITGHVLDESGEPLMRVEVRAMRRDSATAGRLQATGMGGFATTDDLGQFRLYGLPAGEYYVAGRYTGGQMISIVDPRADASPRIGYGPTYYPGSATVEGARRVTVRSGQDTGGIDFSLQRVPLARILGTAYDSTGRPLGGMSAAGGGSVMISSREEPGSGRGSSVRPDGSFVIADVTPGDYYVWATLRSGAGPDPDREAGWAAVTVNGSDVTVNVQTNLGATVSGRVIVEGTDSASPATAANPPRITVAARPDPMLPSFGGFSKPAEVAEDGTFELRGLRGGVILLPNGGRAVVKSVFRGTQDVTGKPMMLQGTERITDLVIVMTTDTATLHGLVTDARGEPAPGVSVVIFPDDPDRWFSGSPFVVTARTLGALPPMSAARMTAMPGQAPAARWTPVVGGFTTARLLPGRYWVAVVPDANAMPPTDRESLDKLRATATSVTVTTGEPATVQLRLPK